MYGAGCAPVCNITDGRDMPIPVFGPIRIQETLAMTPYCCQWRVSDLITNTLPISELTVQDAMPLLFTARTFAPPMVSMFGKWGGKRGVAFFRANLNAPEPMEIRLRFGYDAPFRLWLDGNVIHTDPAGTNPIIVDEIILPISLKQRRPRDSMRVGLWERDALGDLRCDATGPISALSRCCPAASCCQLGEFLNRVNNLSIPSQQTVRFG